MVRNPKQAKRPSQPASKHGRPGDGTEAASTVTRARLIGSMAMMLAGLVLVVVLGWAAMRQAPRPEIATLGAPLIGGPFHMVDQGGRAVDEGILRGKWSLLFFGYTYCPDVCPTTLTALGGATERLGAKADKVQVVFVSVDPGRDTPAQVKTYLESPVFPKNAIGLTGTPAQVAAMAKGYSVFFGKVGEGPDYLLDHTSAIFLMDPKGGFVRLIRPDAGPDTIAAEIVKQMG